MQEVTADQVQTASRPPLIVWLDDAKTLKIELPGGTLDGFTPEMREEWRRVCRADLIRIIEEVKSRKVTAHAEWCMELSATHPADVCASMPFGRLRGTGSTKNVEVSLFVSRWLGSDRSPTMAAEDTSTVTLALIDEDNDAQDIEVDLTIAETRELRDRLSRCVEMAEADSVALGRRS